MRFDDSCLLPESAFRKLEQNIQAIGDPDQCNAVAKRIARMRYENAVLKLRYEFGEPYDTT